MSGIKEIQISLK